MKVCIVGNCQWFTASERGGAEKQSYEIAKAMASRGHDVAFVVPGRVEEGNCHFERIRLIPAWNNIDRGIPGIRGLVGYRKKSMERTLKQIDADLYYTRGDSPYSHILTSATRNLERTSIIALSSNIDLSISKFLLAYRNKSSLWKFDRILKMWLFWHCGLSAATYIGTQNRHQFEFVMKKYGNALMIPNILVPHDISKSCDSRFSYRNAVWIGRNTYVKGVDSLDQLIMHSKELSFRVVGLTPNMLAGQYGKRVEFTGQLSKDEIPVVLRASSVLINTSRIEGFPNTFLEAWYEGLPVVSLNANPNGLLGGDKGFGFCANGSIQRMHTQLKYLIDDNELHNTIGLRSRSYVCSQHSPNRACEIIENLI